MKKKISIVIILILMLTLTSCSCKLANNYKEMPNGVDITIKRILRKSIWKQWRVNNQSNCSKRKRISCILQWCKNINWFIRWFHCFLCPKWSSCPKWCLCKTLITIYNWWTHHHKIRRKSRKKGGCPWKRKVPNWWGNQIAWTNSYCNSERWNKILLFF